MKQITLKKHINNQQGSALSLVLIVLMITMVLITSLMAITTTNQKVGIADKDYTAIYYATEGIFRYELDKADVEINQRYNNSSDKQSFIDSIDDTLNGYVATVNNSDYSKGTFDDSESQVQLLMEAVAGDDWTDNERVYQLKAIGKYGDGNDAIATRKAMLVSNITVKWIEKTTGSGTSGLSQELVWVGQTITLTDHAQIGKQNEEANIVLLNGNDDVILGWNKQDIYADIYIQNDKSLIDLKERNDAPGIIKGDLYKNQTIKEYEPVIFPENELKFFELLENNNSGGSGGIIYCVGNSSDITSTQTTNGNGHIDLTSKGGQSVYIEHKNGGEFHYTAIKAIKKDVVTIHSDKDLEIYCEDVQIHEGGKVVFTGEGTINLYAKNMSISGNFSSLGRESISEEGVKDTIFTQNYLSISNKVSINANVCANANIGMSSWGSIGGALICSTNVTYIGVHESAVIENGVYAPNATINVTTDGSKGAIYAPVICNQLSMTNHAELSINSKENNVKSIIEIIDSNVLDNLTETNTENISIVETFKIKRTYN